MIGQSFNKLSGVGVCFRPIHKKSYEDDLPPFVSWIELLADNFFHVDFDKSFSFLKPFPKTLHCVGTSIGSAQKLDLDYLKKIKNLDNVVEACFISDHLCWSSKGDFYSHDLLPLPYTEETLNLLTEKIKFLIDYFEKPFLLENISAYFSFKESIYEEPLFINELMKRSGGGVLLDVNNVFVNSLNYRFDPYDYLSKIDYSFVKMIHLAGHRRIDNYALDDHSDFVDPEVWKLYEHVIKLAGAVPTCLEWDNKLPSSQDYFAETEKIDLRLKRI